MALIILYIYLFLFSLWSKNELKITKYSNIASLYFISKKYYTYFFKLWCLFWQIMFLVIIVTWNFKNNVGYNFNNMTSHYFYCFFFFFLQEFFRFVRQDDKQYYARSCYDLTGLHCDYQPSETHGKNQMEKKSGSCTKNPLVMNLKTDTEMCRYEGVSIGKCL